MAVHGADASHLAWVLLAIGTHAVVGYALVAVATRAPPAYGLVGAVLPDLDLLFPPGFPFPLVHRGLLHTPLFAGLLVAALAVAGRRRARSDGTNPAGAVDGWGRAAAVATGVGYLSHLVIDSFTASGVRWLYPVSTTGIGRDLGIHAVAFDALISAVAVAALVATRSRERDVAEEGR